MIAILSWFWIKKLMTRLSWMIFNQTRTARVSDYIPYSYVRPWNTNQGSSEKNPSHFSLKCTLLRVNSCKHCNSIDLTKFNNICWCRNLFSIAICKCTPVQSENSQKCLKERFCFTVIASMVRWTRSMQLMKQLPPTIISLQ